MSWIPEEDDPKDRRRRREDEGRPQENPLAGSGDSRPVVFHRKIRCPRCDAKKGIRNIGNYPGLPVTYHECQACGERFKAIERE
ncbi:MAG: hypothetical protein DHS20C21_03190 [Gemmatimonadota bacterium]|nr:MAG: hypothetical protein DHS20C21_03190 [Gemmatimonadota bacterium]